MAALKLNSCIFAILGALMIFNGLTLGIVLKLQATVSIDGEKFQHPFFLVLVMFIGESLWIPLFIGEQTYLTRKYGSIDKSPGMKDAVEKGLKTKINPMILIIPMLLDSAATVFLMIAYINIPASIVQMMVGLVIFVVAILSSVILKTKYHRHHVLGLGILFLGTAFVSVAALLNKDDEDDGDAVFGIIIMVCHVVWKALQYIVEEKLLKSYYLSPFKAVGWQGLTGWFMWSILLIIFQFIPCNANTWNNGKVENSQVAFEFISQSFPLIIYLVLNPIAVAGKRGLAMIVTKYSSATTRLILQQVRIVLVWVFFLIYPGGGHESFKPLQLGGFLVILLGVIIYNEILVIPLWGFDKHTKRAIANKQRVFKSAASITDPSLESDLALGDEIPEENENVEIQEVQNANVEVQEVQNENVESHNS